ncbi:leucine-rich repeat domain-containing protein [Eubacterium coprostanoligenes]|uniref:leucine-rich repeat domain-containing protein n=1 Tax=Eubacterium coprostanoligenes TaxID=290054 RepID=UPI0030C65C34
MAKTELVNGELIITYTDGTQENIGGITSNNSDNKYLKFTEIVGKGEYEVGIKDEYRSSIQYVTVPAIYNGKLVTELADRAFSNCVKLESVSLPNTIKKIKKDSFGGCPIKKMVIPEGVEEIEEDAFTFSALEEIYLPDSLTVIPRDCFNHSLDLKKVILPSNLVKIEEFAFYYCPSLKSITLPDTLKEIGFFAFGMCISLRDLTIPNSVNKIGNGLVIYNSKIKVTFEDTIGWQKRYAELPQSTDDGHNVVDNYYGDWEDIDPSVMADSNELKKLLESSYEDSNGKEYCYEFQKV